MFYTMRNRGFDPFADMRNLQKEMNRLFNGSERRSELSPAVNIWGDENEVIVTAELPGFDPKDLDISVAQGQLSIEGERKTEAPGEGFVCHRGERSSGKFQRSFRLPYDVSNDKISASYKNGVLKITLPRLEESKPRRISVEAT